MHASVGILAPTVLEPDSTVDLTFRVESREDSAYHVRALRLLPTWKPATERSFRFDKVLYPETPRRFTVEGIDVPPAVGGTQGFRVGVEVAEYMTDSMEYGVVWTDPIRLDVADAPSVEAIVYVPDPDSGPRPVERVLERWGFELRQSSGDYRTIRSELADASETLGAVIVVAAGVSDSGDERSRIDDLATVAAEDDVWPVVVKAGGRDGIADGVEEAFVVECDCSDETAVERALSEPLHVVRFAEEGGLSSLLLERMRKRVRQRAEDLAEAADSAGKTVLRKVVENLGLYVLLKEAGAYDEVDELLDQHRDIYTSSGGGASVEIDLTHIADGEAQLLDVRPFYRDDPIWQMERWYGEQSRKDANSGFGPVVEAGILPTASAAFTIHWEPAESDHHANHPFDEGTEIHESERVRRLLVRVPAEGKYGIVPESGMRSWVSFESPQVGIYNMGSDGSIGGNVLHIVEDSDGVQRVVMGLPVSNRGLGSSIAGLVAGDDTLSRWPKRTWYID